ncbi:MAG: peptidoglycan DD-metalloendopeptidase family protein [Bacteroidetes bacterium]|nr:peptidoglycan DD-metalloendopeptidase family protein [Bacteroidota bacterium]
MKRLFVILSITCLGFFNLNANRYSYGDDKNKPGDDKKNKIKRDDTTRFVVNNQNILEGDEESPDTAQILFPSHDLYATWDTLSAHPYNFNECFKVDSVVIQLTNMGDGGFAMPIKGPLTSVFGWRRYRPHYGTDIDIETGDQIVSAFDGMVRFAKYCQGYGNCVIIRHNNGLETVYGHLSKLLVEPGQKVTAGDLIALGGNTGRSSGSHLHFEFRYLGQALDTEDFIDYEKGTLKDYCFTLRKADVENKYDLRALHTRHKRDIGYARATKGGKYTGPAAKNGIYFVRNGDNLGKIAKRNHTTIKSLCKKNRLKESTVLRIGQKIKI